MTGKGRRTQPVALIDARLPIHSRQPEAAAVRAVAQRLFRSVLARSRPARVLALGAAFVTIVAIMQWQLWRGGLSVPITYSGDASFYHSITKTIADYGWYLTNPRLGAPFHQALYDYPLGYDNLNFIGIRILAWISNNPFVINNLFALLTFPTVFAAAWYAFRRLRFSPGISCTAAIVYTLSPYHFVRGDVHLMLAAYYAVPLGCLLLYELVNDDSSGRAGDPVRPAAGWGHHVRRSLLSRWVWVPILLGSSGAYHAVFFSYLAGIVGIGLAVRHGDPRRLVRPLLCVALTLGVLSANNLPTFIYQLRHGSNHQAVTRRLGESDVYGLQVAYLVLPIDHHRIGALADLKDQLKTSVSPVNDPELQGLGAIAAAGLILSLGALFLGGIGSERRDRRSRLCRVSGAFNLSAILLATVGGFSTLLGLLGFVQVHAYNRISIFVAFFSLVALAALFEAWLAKRNRGRYAVGALLVAICAFAVFDQTAVVPANRRQVAAAVASDREFISRIERRLGPNRRVFELPLLDYPESLFFPQPGSFYSTDELGKPALFSESLRWSWGAMKGRPENLTPTFVNRPLESLLPNLAALGFDGIYIDRRGFVDHATQIEARLDSLVAGSRFVSVDGTKSFFDLRQYRHRLHVPAALTDAALHPVQLRWERGFEPADGAGQFFPLLDNLTSGRWAQNNAVVQITNPLPTSRHLTVHLHVQLATRGQGVVEVREATHTQTFEVSGADTPYDLKLDVPPGTINLTFHSKTAGPSTGTAKPPRTFRFTNVWSEPSPDPGRVVEPPTAPSRDRARAAQADGRISAPSRQGPPPVGTTHAGPKPPTPPVVQHTRDDGRRKIHEPVTPRTPQPSGTPPGPVLRTRPNATPVSQPGGIHRGRSVVH